MKATPSTSSSVGDSTSAEDWITPEFTSGLVSVIIPTYNRAELIIEAIDCLRVQTWKSLEVMVVDDGSKDDTLRILKEIPSLGEGRTLHILAQRNAGVSSARNRGTRGSKGEFIIYLDSDDTLVPDAIEHYVETLRASGRGYCYASIDSADRWGRPLNDGGHWHPKPFSQGDLMTNMWQPQGACYCRAAVINAGPWNEQMAGYEDHEFILRIKWTNRGILLPRVQGYYRIHGSDQFHIQQEVGRDFVLDLEMTEIFVDWLKQRGPIPVDTRCIIVERYRFIAFRQGVIGDMKNKDRALFNIGRLLAHSWSPRRLYVLGRRINSARFYSGLANLKQLLTGMKHSPQAPQDTSTANEWIKAEFTTGLVSVIIPTYNRAELVIEAIDSLRAQTWKSLEVIVVDDGSEDDTLRILKEIPSLGDGRSLHLLAQPNAGVSSARNRGTHGSTGEFIIYLDSDDTLVPDAIEHYVATLRRSGSDYCYAQIDSVDENGGRRPNRLQCWHPQPSVPGDLVTNMWLVHAACYRRAAVIRAGPWSENLSCGEDYEFILRIKMTSRGTLMSRVQGYYRMHSKDQLHQLYGSGRDFGPDLDMLEYFTEWLEHRGEISSVIRRIIVERYRFIAFRLGSVGDMEKKNRALLNIARLLAGSWSPRRLYVLGRWINAPWFYGSMANLKRWVMG